MVDSKRELFKSYVKSNVAPLLVDFIDGNNIPNSVVLPSNIEISEFNGHYENINFVPPEWLNKITNSTIPTILVINQIDSIPKNEQTKFIEILKYRQISTFELPKNTVIIVTAKEINENTINEEIYSLVAHIKG